MRRAQINYTNMYSLLVEVSGAGRGGILPTDHAPLRVAVSGGSSSNLSGIGGKICGLIEPCEAFVVKSPSLIFCDHS
jgi:hypothetical protein